MDNLLSGLALITLMGLTAAVSLTFVFASEAIGDFLGGRAFYKSTAKPGNVPDVKKTDLPDQRLRLQLLNQFSSELASAYMETNDLLTEVTLLTTTPENKHFVEQVTSDYYLHIFEAVQNATEQSASAVQKEVIASESLNQLKIIQLGLSKIVDEANARNLNALKTQTDFLRSKVVSSHGLSLTPNELEMEVDASVEQSQRLREELYKKHVAPRIEQNRMEYETKIAERQEEYKAQITDIQGQYESDKKYLAIKNWEYKEKTKKLEAELAATNNSPTNYPSPQSTKERTEEAEPAATIDVAPKVIPSNFEHRIQVSPPLTGKRIQVSPPLTGKRIQVFPPLTADRIYR